jgi:hypothetical protein
MQALAYPIMMLITLVYSYWSMDDAASRQQLRWFAITLGTGVGLYLGIWTVPMQVLRHPLLPWEFQFLVFARTCRRRRRHRHTALPSI